MAKKKENVIDSFIADVDIKLRDEDEWAKIYSVELIGDNIISYEKINEFEWVYRLFNQLSYRPISINGDYSKAEEMEIRGSQILNDILIHATPVEKHILKYERKYTITQYVTNYISGH